MWLLKGIKKDCDQSFELVVVKLNIVYDYKFIAI